MEDRGEVSERHPEGQLTSPGSNFIRLRRLAGREGTGTCGTVFLRWHLEIPENSQQGTLKEEGL